jgi:hypothetical protein
MVAQCGQSSIASELAAQVFGANAIDDRPSSDSLFVQGGSKEMYGPS